MDKAFSRFLLILSIAAFCHSGVQASTPCDSVSQKMMEDTWKEFREIHPFNFQTIALKHYGGDTCVFVMSEPPGWVSQDSIKKLFNSYGGHVGIGKHTWGYDGVLTDAIGCVKLEKNMLSPFECKLFALFYESTYKPYYTNLDNPVSPPDCLSDSLDYLIDEDCRSRLLFAPLFSTIKYKESQRTPLLDISSPIPPVSIHNILMQDHLPSAIYYSITPGYIVWVLDTSYVREGNSIFKSHARKFLLDTDLIIDIIPSQHEWVIIGRERQFPIDVLPPLRAETIMLLAQHATDKLYVHFPEDLAICIEDSLYSTAITMSEAIKHSELGNLMVMAAENSMHNANQQVFDFLVTPRHLDLIRYKQYALFYKAFQAKPPFKNASSSNIPDDTHVWIEAPTAIITNVPFEDVDYVMQ